MRKALKGLFGAVVGGILGVVAAKIIKLNPLRVREDDDVWAEETDQPVYKLGKE